MVRYLQHSYSTCIQTVTTPFAHTLPDHATQAACGMRQGTHLDAAGYVVVIHRHYVVHRLPVHVVAPIGLGGHLADESAGVDSAFNAHRGLVRYRAWNIL